MPSETFKTVQITSQLSPKRYYRSILFNSQVSAKKRVVSPVPYEPVDSTVESRREKLRRWQEEKLGKIIQEKKGKKQPFYVGVNKREIPTTSVKAARQPLAVHNGQSTVKSTFKDTRKNLSSVFHSNDVSLSTITDMLSIKLDFGMKISNHTYF